MLYPHYSEIPESVWRWPDFSPQEPNLACPCCGEFYLNVAAMDALQAVRDEIKRPIRINSGHRCALHNARVGGAPLSQHKLIAFDLSLAGHDRLALRDACKRAGFTGFGYYRTFLHVDPGRRRFWYGRGARQLWNG
ncbi:D-Ala-D-Ala carboxypeptidase family metallohydrolase [Microbulbifer sp. JSM ZJ756]|uniref:D-Ala-D-Ala carboxypeptidase family metallohydrolase n=1 Tax=Microbulbifer sp. JSM ZJ756 TaxID=3376191 RepID=UPI003794E893